MSYLGKEYKYSSEENFAEFLQAVGLPQDQIDRFRNFKPTSKLVKDGDTYTYISNTPEGPKEVKFQSGVEFDDKIQDKIPIKTKYTVDGNTVTQVITGEKGSATFRREYDGDNLTVVITSSVWDGVARRFYKA